jgi:hypothetical protein
MLRYNVHSSPVATARRVFYDKVMFIVGKLSNIDTYKYNIDIPYIDKVQNS